MKEEKRFSKFQFEILKELNNLFDQKEKTWEIIRGIQRGLTLDQIQLYANPNYPSKKMGKIRFGLDK
jgi:hypothetical protein